MADRPLTGIRILDSTAMTAGPWAVQILADLGAEVIKIERPGKQFDVNRMLQPENGTSYYYMCMNKDKKSIQFDYSKPGHKDLYKRLVEQCDIVTENFKAGSMDRQGLGYDDLKQIKPDLIYSAVSGYSHASPAQAGRMGKRRHSEMSELCPQGRSEGYGACADVGHGVGQPTDPHFDPH